MRYAVCAILFASALVTAAAAAEPLPGAPAPEPAMAERIAAAEAVEPPRTRYLASGAPLYRNRLILERSPYLRQHAHNPVDWHPWGEAALAEAARRGVPVFLSVGYATCHWCHVMEEESFDNAEVAALLNAGFVPIKVDRETLPHIDAQYMLATQILNGSGGWPNNVFITPEGEPIVAMGYAPPGSFMSALRSVSEDWGAADGNRAMREQAASVAEFVTLISGARREAAQVDDGVFARSATALLQSHDSFEGGFGEAPKFPNETLIRFLLDRYERNGDARLLDAATTTLRFIARGGIHDHIGGGFHRYAIDSNWRTPHFEKMLYTQALLGRAYVQAWRLTRDPLFERSARRAFDYLLRDMRAPGGAFFAAQDADSAQTPGGSKEEGAYYTWTIDQVTRALGEEAAYLVQAPLGLDSAPTMPTGIVVHLPEDAAPDFDALDPLLERMRLARRERPAPLTDTKVIAGWNGLAIRALAEAGLAFGERRYLLAATEAAAFVFDRMLGADGALARADAGGPLESASLRDYAWLGLAALALFDATGERANLDRAERLADQIPHRFGEDADDAGPFRLSQAPGPLGPGYDTLEGATPTGNASTLELFAQLSRRLQDDPRAVAYRERADRLLAALSAGLAEAPENHISAVTAAAVHRNGEVGPVRSLGNGAVRAQLTLQDARLAIALDFAPGWHANSDTPQDENLVPTLLSGAGLDNIRYPQAHMVTLGFQAEPLAVFDGAARIEAETTPDAREAILDIQICRDDLCLPPERAIWRLPGGAR